jgi:acetyltransferase
LIRFSYLVADCPQIGELDINPLLATPHGAMGLDARVILDRRALAEPPAPFAHLAIRPYPEEFVRPAKLKNGAPVLLRPIKPEDEPLWHALLADCSQQSLWFRFRYLFKEATHEMASRFCFIDYDRELAIVAEVEQEGRRRLAAVGRLVADPDHQQAEYAVLVIDAYQGQGLGKLLTAYCLEIAERWKLKRVYGETSPDNHRMLATFRGAGFEFDHSLAPDVVLARKTVG